MQACSRPVDTSKPVWIFGYGSLIHTPNFQYQTRVVGYIKGYRRVFWQGSTDHRGTAKNPGRTVTLTADGDQQESATTWGVAFQLTGTPAEQAATLSYLEWREKQYDVRQFVDVYGANGDVLVSGALVYIASPANANYLGPADPRVIATQIATCRGPSGPNWEYLFRLADAMRSMGVPDQELFELELAVRQELAARSREGADGAVAGGVHDMDEMSHGHAEFRLWHLAGAALPQGPELPQQEGNAVQVAEGQRAAGLNKEASMFDQTERSHSVANVRVVSCVLAEESEPG